MASKHDERNGGPGGSLTVRNIQPTLADIGEVRLPLMTPVRQLFPGDRVTDIEVTVRGQLAQFSGLDLRGKEIAVTAGSRGIKGVVKVLRAVVGQLREWGASPFIVPTMGSHGGATAAGQAAVLEKLGLTEETIGAPIRSSMEVVALGTTAHGVTVHCDRLAFESDGIVVCNRIKAHTAFKGDFESGLVKMMLIGLGKHKGATDLHHLGFDRFNEIFPAAGRLFLDKAPVLFGVGLVENAYSQVAAIEAMAPERLMERERELLRYAKAIMGRLLLPDIDVLIVDEIGKDISGGGMDSNVTGRSTWGLPGFEAPPIQRIVVRDLTDATAGSSMGLGLADFTTRRCAEKIDLAVTYTNAMTALALVSAKVPLIAASDRDAILLAVRTSRHVGADGPRIAQIRNTKDLEDIWLSESYLPETRDRGDILVQGDPNPFQFNDAGDLKPWPQA